MTYREQAVTFGADRGLVGVVTSAPSAKDEVSPLAVVILNAGVIHRVGPSRISVRLARVIAGLGPAVLRFDQSGIGDSSPRRDTHDLEDAVERDIDDAMTYLQQSRHATRFVLVGICSGARESLRKAYGDERVSGLILIDPPAYRTFGFLLRHYPPRLFDLEVWRRALRPQAPRTKGPLGQVADPVPVRPAAQSQPDRLPLWPTRGEMKHALNRLLAREARMLVVFTRREYEYNYRTQFRDAFPEQCAHDKLTWRYHANTSHTFKSEAQRLLLLDAIREWFDMWLTVDRFPASHTRPPHASHC